MDYILPNEVEMEKMAEEYAKIKILRPKRHDAIVETMSVPEEEDSAEKASRSNARAVALSAEIVVLLCALQNLCPEKAAATQIERVIFDKKQTAENLFPYDFHGQISENTAFGAKSVPYFQLGKDILFKQMTLITALNSYSKNLTNPEQKRRADDAFKNEICAFAAISALLF